MLSEGLKKALRFEDLNLRLAALQGRTGRQLTSKEVDRFMVVMDAAYTGLSLDERDAANRYGKHKWRRMGGKVNAAEERVLPHLKRQEQARHQ